MSVKTTLLCFSYACSSQSEELTQRVKHSNKILLPPSVLHTINNENAFSSPLFFQIKNLENQMTQVCGMQEFSAPPGVAHVPYHVMESLGIKEGTNVEFELATPVDGTYVKFRLHSSDFADVSDPKAVLERVLSRDYPVITEGHTIAINYAEMNRVFYIDVVETKPAPVIKIINVNINVDFDTPLDYVEPEPEEVVPEPVVNNYVDVSNNEPEYDMTRFPGRGRRLGTA